MIIKDKNVGVFCSHLCRTTGAGKQSLVVELVETHAPAPVTQTQSVQGGENCEEDVFCNSIDRNSCDSERLRSAIHHDSSVSHTDSSLNTNSHPTNADISSANPRAGRVVAFW